MTKSRNHLEDEDDDDDFDENGLLKDGRSYRTPMYFMDGVQRLVAMRSMRLCDALGQPLTGHKPGYAFDARSFDDPSAANHRAQLYDFEKAQLSSAWKGGLQDGDHLTLGGRRLEVTGHDQGKVVLADTSQVDAESIRRDAYQDYETTLASAWKTRTPIHGAAEGDICTINGAPGHWHREADGKLVCRPDHDTERDARKVTQRDPFGREKSTSEPSRNEWALTGPLSDGQSVKQQAYDTYKAELISAWRRG